LTTKTLAELFSEGATRLGDSPEAAWEAKILLLRAARISEEKYFSSPSRPVPGPRAVFYLRLVERRRAGWPVSYLTGSKEFWSLPLRVTPAVLIPRPETEMLVERVLALSGRGPETVLDVGTGSGNIAIALARELPAARIYAADISLRALNVARRNAERLGCGGITFVRSNLLASFRGAGLRFDFIVSNPPYVSAADWSRLPDEIRAHEPRRALLAGETGLDVIRRLVARSRAFLRPGAYLIFEIGDGQHREVLSLFGRGWTEVETGWDLSGKPRVITARAAR
jgi:release factor glutamine methyltransferase